MPPIKRTKFKLAPEQLLEMFYWLKLIRAFDERLSILVKQGKVRSGVYTGIGQEAIIVGTCFGAAQGGLHLPAASRPRRVPDEGRRAARR